MKTQHHHNPQNLPKLERQDESKVLHQMPCASGRLSAHATGMEYELARQLKEAGFPQTFEEPFDFFYPEADDSDYQGVQHCSGQEVDSGCYGLGVADGKIEDWAMGHKYDDQPVSVLIKAPTLSELIEACGDTGFVLDKTLSKGWFASNKSYSTNRHGYGHNTPEEAVARLWLALNKKV